MQPQTAQPLIHFSFILGGNTNEAIQSLSDIKDAMAAALVLHAEDDNSLDMRTLDFCRMFYLAADDQYRELLTLVEEEQSVAA